MHPLSSLPPPEVASLPREYNPELNTRGWGKSVCDSQNARRLTVSTALPRLQRPLLEAVRIADPEAGSASWRAQRRSRALPVLGGRGRAEPRMSAHRCPEEAGFSRDSRRHCGRRRGQVPVRAAQAAPDGTGGVAPPARVRPGHPVLQALAGGADLPRPNGPRCGAGVSFQKP